MLDDAAAIFRSHILCTDLMPHRLKDDARYHYYFRLITARDRYEDA